VDALAGSGPRYGESHRQKQALFEHHECSTFS
jgi:hypothetical protein